MSSPSFDRGMGGGKVNAPMVGPAAPDPDDVRSILSGNVPNYRNVQSSFFPQLGSGRLGRAVEGGVLGAALTQQGETTGENISNVAHALLAIPQMHKALMYSQITAPYEQADKMATIQDKLAMIPLRQAMMARYNGMADYYEGRNETQENIARDNREGRNQNALDRLNTQLAPHNMQWQQDAQGHHFLGPVAGMSSQFGQGIAPQHDPLTMGYTPAQMAADAVSGDPAKQQKAANAQHFLARGAGERAGASAEARSHVTEPLKVKSDAEKHYTSTLKQIDQAISQRDRYLNDPKKFYKDATPDQIKAWQGQWKGEKKQLQQEREFVNKTHTDYQKEFNPRDPYPFDQYLQDRRGAMADQQAQTPTPTQNPSSAPKGQWNPVAGRYE